MSINRDLFLLHQAQTSPTPILLEVEKAEGVYLYATDGKKYLDLISGIAVSNVGHCAPEVVQAVQNQVSKYMHTMVYGEYVLQPSAEFAAKLITELTFHKNMRSSACGVENCNASNCQCLQSVYFTNSGAEAVEGALKIAKKYTGRKKLLSCLDSYHGSTAGALSVTGTDWIKEGYGDFLPHVSFIRFNNFDDLALITEEVAAIILEPIQGEAGVIMPEKGFLQAVRHRCDATGALMILDEIQTGFGRTGSLFAHQHFGIMPDILLLAKGMGGGMPIGAFVAKRKIMNVLQNDPILGHITTFGGHPVTCAAGLACLNKILNEKLLDTIPHKAQLIQNTLSHPKIKEIRGLGLMWAVELDSFESVLKVVQIAMSKGVITDWFLSKSSAIRIAPPLIISQDELRFALQVLQQAIEEVCG